MSTNTETLNLFELGTLVNLHIKSWSGRKMLTRADMQKVGINPDNLPSEIVNFGRKLLVPKADLQRINKIEQRARTYLSKWSAPFGIANSHFVPLKMIETVENTLKQFQQEYMDEVKMFINRFENMKSEVQSRYPEFWVKCLKDHYPATPELLRDKFQFNWFMFKIAGMDALKETSAEELKEKYNTIREQIKEGAQKFVEDYVVNMRKSVVNFCELMQARINGKPYKDETEAKKLTPRSLSYFKKHIERFGQMNIFGDKEIEKMLNEFKDNFLDEGINTKHFENAQVQNTVTQTLSNIIKQASMETEQFNEKVGSLKRKIVI